MIFVIDDCLLGLYNEGMNAQNINKAVIVVRVSTAQQASSDVGINAQIEKCRSFASANGLDVVAIVEDLAVSGSVGIEKRAGLSEAKEMVMNGDVGVVITYSLSRIGRNLLNILKFIDDCGFKSGKARLVCVADNIDTKNGGPMSNMLLSFMGIISEMELQNITERNRSVKMYLKGNNRYCGGNTGKFLKVEVRDGKKYVGVDNKELLNRIVEMRNSGMTLKMISDGLKSEGVMNSRGTHYSIQSLCQIIKRYGQSVALMDAA